MVQTETLPITDYWKIMIKILDFLSEHEYTNEIALAEIINLVDDLEQICKATKKK